MIDVTCGCGKSFRAKDEHAGKTVHCPACKGAVYVRGVKPAPLADDPDGSPSVFAPGSLTAFEAKVLRHLATLVALVALVALPIIAGLVLWVATLLRSATG